MLILLTSLALAGADARLTFDPPALVPGETVSLLVDGAPPGATVVLIRSVGGPGAGPCRPSIGACLDVTYDLTLVGVRTADVHGRATWSTVVPPLPPRDAWWQAVAYGPGYAVKSDVVFQPVATPCVDDAFEDDDSVGTARSPGSSETHVACPGDDDHFLFSVPAGYYLEGNVTSDHEQEGVVRLSVSMGTRSDSTATFYDGAGSAAIANTYSFTTTARAEVSLADGEDRGVAAGAAYAVSFTVRQPPLCGGYNQEPDDTRAEARLMTSGTSWQAHACRNDSDWVAVDAVAGDAVQIDLDYDRDDGHCIHLFLFDPSGAEIDADDTSCGVRVARIAPTTGRYTARILMQEDDARGGGVPYTVTATARPRTPCPTDAFEPNDVAASAVDLPEGTHTGLGGCTADGYDWYRVDLQPWERLEAWIPFDSYDSGDGTHGLYVVDAPVANADLAAHRVPNEWTYGGSDHVRFTSPTGGTYYVVVSSQSDTSWFRTSYLTSGGNTYDLVLDIR